MKKIMFFLVSLFIFFNVLSVNAAVYSNYETTYTSDYNCIFYDDTKKNFFNGIINLQSNYYDLVIIDEFYTNGGSPRYRLLLVPNDNTKISLEVGYSQNLNIENLGSLSYYLINYTGVKYYLSYDYNTNNTTYTNFYNCYVNNQCTGATNFNRNSAFANNLQPYTVNNSDSYNFYSIPRTDNISGGTSSLLYYSSLPVEFTSGITTSGTNNNVYNKNIIINNQEYTINDNFPSYYQYCSSVPVSVDTKQQDTQINSIYLKIPVSDINNFEVKFSFESTILNNGNYFDNFLFRTPIVNGRVNHNGDYFTFESIDCDYTNVSYNFVDNRYIVKFNNLTCNNVNTSNYDYIYVTSTPVYNNWDINYNKEIIGIQLSTTSGYIKYMNYLKSIYEYFPSLPSGFKIFFSSLGTTSNYSSGYELDLYSSTDNTMFSAYLTDDFTQLNIDDGYVSKDYQNVLAFPSVTHLYLNNSLRLTQNYGYMIYNNIYDNITPITQLSAFFDNDVMYSYEYQYNSYYYYDVTDNSIKSTNIILNDNLVLSNEQNIDVSSSISIINNYINSLSLQINDFSKLVNDFYLSLPVVIQTFILVLFNIVCFKELYKLIEGSKGKGD